MALAQGSQFAEYEIVATLGIGAMGEVYRARDTRLGRDVALKVLPERFRLDAARLARFTREAQMLASLNHPNIATLHAVVEIQDAQALVLELVEGDTLAERIVAGPLPVGESLAVALQIAAALEAAHDHGIVHRDLKPANVKLRPDGTVKLLDFGLAKVVDPAVEGAGSCVITITAADIAPGGPLGTPAYMSPEQTRGAAVDQRGDVWALGCVLFEMLTGRRAFAGETVSDSIAAILEREPNWSVLPPDCPAVVQRLLRRSLVKDRNDRLRHVGDARIDLKEAILLSTADVARAEPPARTGHGRMRQAWLAAGAIVAAGIASIAFAVFRSPNPPDRGGRALRDHAHGRRATRRSRVRARPRGLARRPLDRVLLDRRVAGDSLPRSARNHATYAPRTGDRESHVLAERPLDRLSRGLCAENDPRRRRSR
jgi:eukaryotic-like serine/threonine-protein kinase